MENSIVAEPEGAYSADPHSSPVKRAMAKKKRSSPLSRLKCGKRLHDEDIMVNPEDDWSMYVKKNSSRDLKTSSRQLKVDVREENGNQAAPSEATTSTYDGDDGDDADVEKPSTRTRGKSRAKARSKPARRGKRSQPNLSSSAASAVSAESTEAPPVIQAAFSGPPRYDWIDIETSAAVRIQSIFRRNQAMARLEAQGMTTSNMRNRKRRNKAKAKARLGGHRSKAKQSADAPSFLGCCGVGLAFGDATEEDDDAYKAYQKRQYQEQQARLEAHEAMLRNQFKKNHKLDIRNKRGVVESLEVTNK